MIRKLSEEEKTRLNVVMGVLLFLWVGALLYMVTR